MIPWGAGIGRGKNFTLGTPIFISRRALSSTDKVTCTPRVLIPSNSFTLALHSCMLSGCPCVCVCVCVCVCAALCVSTCQSQCRLLLVYPLLHASLPCLPLCLPLPVFLPTTVSIGISPIPLGPSFSLVSWPSRLCLLLFLPSSHSFLSPLFSFLLLFPSSSFSFLLPLSPPSPLFLLFFLCLCLSLSAYLYNNISLQDCRCLSSNNPISSQMTSQALKAS